MEEITSNVAGALRVSEHGSPTKETVSQDANAFAPALPPLVASSREKSMDQLVAEFKQTPLFMTELPEDDEENVAIEALKALQYEGTPLENAQDFKEQGNEHFQSKIWPNAKELYTKGINILFLEERKRRLAAKARTQPPSLRNPVRRESDAEAAKDAEKETSSQRKLLETLYVNRAATHLELKNYRSASLDCAAALRLNPSNVKALYRSGKALLAVARIQEADDVCARGLSIDPGNKALRTLAEQIVRKAEEVDAKNKAENERREREKHKELVLRTALKARGIRTRTTDKPPEMEDARMKMVPDEHSPTSTLSFPAVLLYPADLESDFIKEFHEEQCLADHLAYVFPLPWDSKNEYTLDGVECYMDTLTGGLVKVGKKVPLLKVLGGGKVELIDGIVRLFVLPKPKAEPWAKEHKERRASEMGEENSRRVTK